jgi:hypothetical protein
MGVLQYAPTTLNYNMLSAIAEVFLDGGHSGLSTGERRGAQFPGEY